MFKMKHLFTNKQTFALENLILHVVCTFFMTLFEPLQVLNVESRWLNLLFKMAERSPSSSEVLLSGNRITQIREMLSKAARMRRTDSTGDLMPNVCLCEVLNYLTPSLIELSWLHSVGK